MELPDPELENISHYKDLLPEIQERLAWLNRQKQGNIW